MPTTEHSGRGSRDRTDERSVDARTDGGRQPQAQRSAGTAGNSGLPIGTGFTAGIAAFAVGYLITYVQKSGDASEALGQLSQLGASPEPWQAVGWVFSAMHNAGVEASASAGSRSFSETMTSGMIQEQWLLLVPVLTLVGAGYYVASQQSARSNVSGVVAGATVVAGYAVGMVALAFLSKWTLSTSMLGQTISVTIGPKLVETVAIGGLGYPVVLGGIGGALGDA